MIEEADTTLSITPDANGTMNGSWHQYRIHAHELPTVAVVYAVSATIDTSVRDMEPLYQTIDPDALNAIFRDDRGNGLLVKFSYHGCEVCVTDRYVRVRGERPPNSR